ncbi:MAG TPA: hypothetical protein VII83_07685 [Gaiellaceae bacterium]|jgi:hypothetical protein
MTKLMKSSWFVASTSFVLVSGVAVATWVRGDHGKALQVLGLGAVIALFLLAAGRSKSLRRQFFATDERSDAIGMFAATWAGFALFGVLFVIFLVEDARGHSGEPYYWLSGLYFGLFVLFAVARSFKQ